MVSSSLNVEQYFLYDSGKGIEELIENWIEV